MTDPAADSVTEATEALTAKSNLLAKSLFQVAMGDRFFELPHCLQTLHGPDAATVWTGEARTQTGKTWLARLISRTVGLTVPSQPGLPDYKPLQVTFERFDNSEKWTRNFNGHFFNSHFTLGKKYKDGTTSYVAIENFGLFKFELDLLIENERLYFNVDRCTFLNLPLPAVCLPKGESYEFEHNRQFNFTVEIRVPIAGLIAAYDGWLVPEKTQDPL